MRVWNILVRRKRVGFDLNCDCVVQWVFCLFLGLGFIFNVFDIGLNAFLKLLFYFGGLFFWMEWIFSFGY